jgi:hypothetical protein
MKKFIVVLFVFMSIQLSACQSDVYEENSVIMKEEYSESSNGNGIFEVFAILGVVYVLVNLGKR